MIIYVNFRYRGEGRGERGGSLQDMFRILGSVFGILFYSLCGELGARGEGCFLAVYNHQISKLQIIDS